MSLNKKVLSLAVLGALASGSAFAADLSDPDGAVPAYFAQEIIASPAAPRTLGTSASGATLNWNIGYNFSENEVRYARVQCSDNLRFGAGTTVTSSDAAAVSIGAINGLNSQTITFSLTAIDASNLIAAADRLTINGNHAITGTDQDVTCSVALYDQPSQAQAGGEAGRIAGSVFSGAYLSFVRSYELTSAVAYTNVADVEADPSFSAFDVVESDSAGALWANVGALTYRVRDPDGPAGAQTAAFNVNGAPISLTDLFAANTRIQFTGDLSAYNQANFLGSVTPTAPATTLASPISFTVGATTLNSLLFSVYKPASTLIQESEYFASLIPVAANPTVYAVTAINNVRVGEIVRNGTQLQAPLVQLPGGGRWQSRVVLTNTGSLDRGYTISLQTEQGVNVNPGNLTGTIPANSTVVLNVDDIVSFPGRARATLNVSVAAPNNQIQGLYQIVDVDNGGISNETMVRPGTN